MYFVKYPITRTNRHENITNTIDTSANIHPSKNPNNCITMVAIPYIAIFALFIVAIFSGFPKKECVLEENISEKFAIISCNGNLHIARRTNDQ